MTSARLSQRIFSVRELNREVRTLIESELGIITLEGEISNLAMPASGHWYFSLKDTQAQVRAAMFKMANRRVAFRPENGMVIQAQARVSLYEPRGDYQLIVEAMQETGDGALQRAFELLRQKLDSEGLFNPEAKQPLPERMSRIGVMTSATGAALQDILSVLKRRNRLCEIILYPVPVQGFEAASKMQTMLSIISERAEIDVLIIARGGGAAEDLAAFNEETLIRAIAAMEIPTVSGVGHETDVTLCDYVVDQRAPTPSAAAELVSTSLEERSGQLRQLQQRLRNRAALILEQNAQRCDHLASRLDLQSPQRRVIADHQRIEQSTRILIQSITKNLTQKQTRLTELRYRLAAVSPSQQLEYRSNALHTIDTKLQHAVSHLLRNQQQAFEQHAFALNQASPGLRIGQSLHKLQSLAQTMQSAQDQNLRDASEKTARMAQALDNLSPLRTMSRGFAYISDDDNSPVSSVSQLAPADTLKLNFKDGNAFAVVQGINPK